MDYLSKIKQPIESEFADFIEHFNQSLQHEDGLLGQALQHISQRSGKRMRPLLVLLIAKNFGVVSSVTHHAAVALELLHTASLIHDDVVDESDERRGQASVNASYNNKVAVLVGDFVLSTALLQVSYTHSDVVMSYIADLGRALSHGEILQLSAIQESEVSEPSYYEVIKRKTAALFEACAALGAETVGATAEQVCAAKRFGQLIGIIFQIRDDIFDYGTTVDIGKPTGNDMREGKLTLPVIYALKTAGNHAMKALAEKVKSGTISTDEIDTLVRFSKENGGISYAEAQMQKFHAEAQAFLSVYVHDDSIRDALQAYLDYVIERQH